MENRWFKNAVIYCVDVDTFRDGNGDNIGDFIGLRQALADTTSPTICRFISIWAIWANNKVAEWQVTVKIGFALDT